MNMKQVTEKIISHYKNEYLKKRYAEHKWENRLTNSGFITSTLLAITLLSAVPLAVATFLVPSMITTGIAASTYMLFGGLAAVMGLTTVTAFRNDVKATKAIKKDINNGTLLDRYTQEVLPKQKTDLDALAKKAAADFNAQMVALDTESNYISAVSDAKKSPAVRSVSR